MGLRTRTIVYDFRGAHKPPAVASRQGIWCSKITASEGSPTVQSGSGGAMELTLTNDSEAQNLCLYMGDVLPFDIDDLIRVWFIAKISASLDASVRAVLGLASARNDDPDAIAQGAWFQCAGSNALTVETDDGVTDVNDVAADGLTLADAYKELVIDFSEGIRTQSPPAASQGGKAAVGFYAGNASGSRRRVAANQAFDMSGYAGPLQLIAQLQKTSGAATGTLSILEAGIELKLPA